jgi:hypothetical protein
MKKSILFAALAVIATAPVLAGTPRLDAREFNQRARIHNGVASGELTRPETRRLAAGQVHLRRAEARRPRPRLTSLHIDNRRRDQQRSRLLSFTDPAKPGLNSGRSPWEWIKSRAQPVDSILRAA